MIRTCHGFHFGQIKRPKNIGLTLNDRLTINLWNVFLRLFYTQRIIFHEILQYGLVSTFDLRCEEKKCRPMLTLSDGHGRRINSVKFMERDDQLVTSSNDKNIRIWDLRNGRLLNKIQVCFAITTLHCNFQGVIHFRLLHLRHAHFDLWLINLGCRWR